MALKATVYKAELAIADMDRHYYHTHPLTIALHPSETIERMMVRLAVFARYASEHLQFTRGLSTDDEPDLWQKTYTGDIEHWIELGQLDEKRLKKAVNQSQKVTLVGYHGNAFDVWWQQNQNKCQRHSHLEVIALAPETVAQLTQLVNRSMRIQANISDGTLWLSDEQQNVEVNFTTLQSSELIA